MALAPAPATPLPAEARPDFAIIGPQDRFLYTDPNGFGQSLIVGDLVRFVRRDALTLAQQSAYAPNTYARSKPNLLAVLTSGGAAGDEERLLGLLHHWDNPVTQVWDARYACANQAQVNAATPILLGLPPRPFNLSEIYEPNTGLKKHNAGTPRREIFRLTLL